jgi:hypothetical protein
LLPSEPELLIEASQHILFAANSSKSTPVPLPLPLPLTLMRAAEKFTPLPPHFTPKLKLALRVNSCWEAMLPLPARLAGSWQLCTRLAKLVKPSNASSPASAAAAARSAGIASPGSIAAPQAAAEGLSRVLMV